MTQQLILQMVKELLAEQLRVDPHNSGRILREILRDAPFDEQYKDENGAARYSKYISIFDQVVNELEEITSFIAAKGKSGATTQEIREYLSDGKKHSSVIRDRLDKLLLGNIIRVQKEEAGNFKRNLYHINSNELAPPVP